MPTEAHPRGVPFDPEASALALESKWVMAKTVTPCPAIRDRCLHPTLGGMALTALGPAKGVGDADWLEGVDGWTMLMGCRPLMGKEHWLAGPGALVGGNMLSSQSVSTSQVPPGGAVTHHPPVLSPSVRASFDSWEDSLPCD